MAKRKKRKSPARKSKPKARAKSRKPSTLQRTLTGLTAERRIDIVGVSATLIGVLTVLAMVSNTPGGVGEAWTIFLKRSFGWGVYLLPLGLIVIGLWLLLRNIEQVPPPKLQKSQTELIDYMTVGGLLVVGGVVKGDFVGDLSTVRHRTAPSEVRTLFDGSEE